MATEADTCWKFVVPKLQAAGWDSDPHSIAIHVAQAPRLRVSRSSRSVFSFVAPGAERRPAGCRNPRARTLAVHAYPEGTGKKVRYSPLFLSTPVKDTPVKEY